MCNQGTIHNQDKLVEFLLNVVWPFIRQKIWFGKRISYKLLCQLGKREDADKIVLKEQGLQELPRNSVLDRVKEWY